MKQLVALCLMLTLLAGCGAGPVQLVPQQPTVDPVQVTPRPVRSLAVYDETGLLAEPLRAYSQHQQVSITAAQQPGDAALVIRSSAPAEGESLNLAQGSGLVKGMAGLAVGEGTLCTALVTPGDAYGYLINTAVLQAMFEDAPSAKDLQACSYAEWSVFVETLDQWLQNPSSMTAVLNGTEYTFSAEKTGAAQALCGVFTVAGEDQFTGPVLSPVLATCYANEDDFLQKTTPAQKLQGALNSYYLLLAQETASMAGPEGKIQRGQDCVPLTRQQAQQAYFNGQAVFYRTRLSEAANAEGNHALVPVKFSFDETDLNGGLSLQQLQSMPVAISGQFIFIPAAAHKADVSEAQAFLLWLFASEAGQQFAPQPQAEGGIANLSTFLSEACFETARAQGRQLLQKTQWQSAERRAFVSEMLACIE